MCGDGLLCALLFAAIVIVLLVTRQRHNPYDD